MLAQLKIPGFSPIPTPPGLKPELGTLGGIITALLNPIFVISGLLLLLLLIAGGFQILVSGGDPKALQSARGRITAAVVGFIIIFVSFWVFKIIGIVLGIDFFAG